MRDCPVCDGTGRIGGREPHVYRLGGVVLDEAARRVTIDGESVRLTPQEFGILATLIRLPDVVFSYDAIMNSIGAYDIYPDTIKVVIHTLRRKLRGAVRIVTLHGIGLRLEPSEMPPPPLPHRLVRIAAALALAVGLAAAPAAAQQPQPQPLAKCDRYVRHAERLGTGYGELPAAFGLRAGGNLLQVFASPRTGSWTLLEVTPGGMSCILAAGKNWQATPQPDPGA